MKAYKGGRKELYLPGRNEFVDIDVMSMYPHACSRRARSSFWSNFYASFARRWLIRAVFGSNRSVRLLLTIVTILESFTRS
jgi:hypothetical protein